MQVHRGRNHCVCSIIMLGLLLTAVGCKNKPPQPPPSPPEPPPLKIVCHTAGDPVIVQVNVTRVLHNGAHAISADTVGGRTNYGCRLTDDEIRAYIAQASAFYRTACKVQLQWEPPTINDYRCDLKLGLNDNAGADLRGWRTLNHFLFFELQDIEHNHYVAERLNVFFGGNYRFDRDDDFLPDPIDPHSSDPQCLVANTLDPADQAMLITPWGQVVLKHHILITDLGGLGSDPKQARFEPHWGVLEHEIAHFFLRRRGEGAPGQYDPTPYNISEHSEDAQWPCIMRALPPHPNKFALDESYPICEQYEIWLQAQHPFCPRPESCQN